jgi:arginyl-tRNA synthetase
MIEKIEEQSKQIIRDAVVQTDYDINKFPINIFPEASDATVATPVSFQIANKNKASPEEVAENISNSIYLEDTYFSSVETSGPYINLFASDEWFSEVLSNSLSEEYGKNLVNEKLNIGVEHTSVNPTGPLHIGRVRNSIIGDCISNVLEYAGHRVSRDYYVNDAGLQVAMLVWGYHNYEESELPEPDIDSDDCRLVRYYRKAASELDTDIIKSIQQNNIDDPEKYKENAVIEILHGLENGDTETVESVSDVVNTMLSSQLESLNDLGVTFDEFTYESDYLNTPELEKLLLDLKSSEMTFKENGAWKINLEDHNIEKDFVFERSNGTTLYGTRDILYHIDKSNTYDESILILGEDQEVQAKSVRAVMEVLGYDSSNLPVIHHAFVQTPEGGMSTRQGEGDFLYEVRSRAEQKAHQAIDKHEVEDIESVVKDVVKGSLRYNIISKKRQQLATFDVERAVSVQSQTGPSIQYAYARMNGIIENTNYNTNTDLDCIQNPVSYNLVEVLSKFPKVIKETIKSSDPHHLATYAKELKDVFNDFYNNCPVSNEDNEDLASVRYTLTIASKNVMGSVLDLMGIPKIRNM